MISNHAPSTNQATSPQLCPALFRYALVVLNRQRYYYNRDFKKVKPFSVFLLRNLRFLPELLRRAVLRLPRKQQIFHSGEEACARPPQKGCCAIEIKKLQNSCKALKIDSAERKDFFCTLKRGGGKPSPGKKILKKNILKKREMNGKNPPKN